MDRKVSNHGWKKDGGRVMKSGKRNWGGGGFNSIGKMCTKHEIHQPNKRHLE